MHYDEHTEASTQRVLSSVTYDFSAQDVLDLSHLLENQKLEKMRPSMRCLRAQLRSITAGILKESMEQETGVAS
jgi:hypothetical protein